MLDVLEDIPRGLDEGIDACCNAPDTKRSCSPKIDRHIRAFLLYHQHVKSGNRFLDWGCKHALDSCMVRLLNPNATIDGCDISDEIVEHTRTFSGMTYTKLTHPFKLPYKDGQFDRVISSGVLEHAPMTYASLTEINRVIEPGGLFIVTFLPNAASYTEFVSRTLIKHGQHTRVYSRSRLKHLLLDHGFEPIETGFHQFLPSLSTHGHFFRSNGVNELIRTMFRLDPTLERIWPLNRFCANLYAVARKKTYM